MLVVRECQHVQKAGTHLLAETVSWPVCNDVSVRRTRGLCFVWALKCAPIPTRVNQVLPALVPAPLETFSWEDMQDIQYMPGQTKLHEYQW